MGSPVFLSTGVTESNKFIWSTPPNSNILVATASTNLTSQPMYRENIYTSYMAAVRTTAGAAAATISIYGTDDANTGRGFTLAGQGAPGMMVNTTVGSPTLAAATPGLFGFSNSVNVAYNLIGAQIVHPAFPQGTTVTAVASNGSSITASANATATTVNSQGQLVDNNWVATALGVITLTGAGGFACDGFASGPAAWRFVHAIITGLSGTGAAVTVWQGA